MNRRIRGELTQFEIARRPKNVVPRVFSGFPPWGDGPYSDCMFAQTLLLSAVLAHLTSPGFHLSSGGALPWVTATALGARLHRDLGVVPEAALGFRGGRPMVLAVVPIKLGVGLAAGPWPSSARRDAKVFRTWEPADFVRAEVRTAQAFFKMAAAARRAGIRLQVNSGFRTSEEQRQLYNLYRRGRGPLAAKPGGSNHQSGHALDLDTRSPQVRRWLWRHAFRFGFRRTVACERWHYEHWDIAEHDLAGSLRS